MGLKLKIGTKLKRCERCSESISKGKEAYFYGYILYKSCFIKGRNVFVDKYHFEDTNKLKLKEWINGSLNPILQP